MSRKLNPAFRSGFWLVSALLLLGSTSGAQSFDYTPTAPSAISPSGDIIGTYIAPVSSAPFGSPEFCSAVKPASCIKGFLYSRGKFSTVLFPLTPPASGYHPG